MTLEIEDSERTPDELDRAAVIADAHNRACIDKVRHALRPEQEPDEFGTYAVTECVECGDTIPVERLNMGKIYCVFCQEQRERNGRGHGRR